LDSVIDTDSTQSVVRTDNLCRAVI